MLHGKLGYFRTLHEIVVELFHFRGFCYFKSCSFNSRNIWILSHKKLHWIQEYVLTGLPMNGCPRVDLRHCSALSFCLLFPPSSSFLCSFILISGIQDCFSVESSVHLPRITLNGTDQVTTVKKYM